MSTPLLHIEQCGFLTSLQDTGRKGYLQYGVSKGGAMDQYAAELANTLVGNTTSQAVLEITQSPHRFRVLKDTVVAFTGGGLQPQINDVSIPLLQPQFVSAGTVISCKQPLPGFRLYMAVAGGFAAEQFLGSSSTDLLLTAGGLNGRTLKKEDVLEQRNKRSPLQQSLLNVLKAGAAIELPVKPVAHTTIIRVLQGPEWHFLTAEANTLFSNSSFTVTANSNRMGYRIKGIALPANRSCNIISSPVTQGTVQLTDAGEMILLMADAQTVGGYPRIAQVCAADLSLLAQKKPTDTIQFQIVSLQEAEELYVQQQNELKKTAGILQSKL
ncbi:MAG: biotin-dependent carboxyltransferase [Chitinophagaceae bacterium]|nr:biotin-dependent carboxyltransferase [Chitinophagaceae bacterium]